MTLVSARLQERPFESALGSPADDPASRLIDECCEVTPPEFLRVFVTDSVSMSPGGGGGARSRKLGNIAVSPRKLLMTLPAMISSLWLQDHPWAAAFMALSLLESILSKTELQIQEREATVLWAIWLNRDAMDRIPKEALLAVVNSERADHGRAGLSPDEFVDALALLVELGCIRDEESSWRLCESVQVEFS
ncbi:MAG: hypothetical protein ABSF35_23645 [Polyangia bacterium]